MTDGLKDAHREAIIAVIAANDRVERAVLFGSRATGTNTVTSDVDIALFGDQLTLTDQARLAAGKRYYDHNGKGSMTVSGPPSNSVRLSGSASVAPALHLRFRPHG